MDNPLFLVSSPVDIFKQIIDNCSISHNLKQLHESNIVINENNVIVKIFKNISIGRYSVLQILCEIYNQNSSNLSGFVDILEKIEYILSKGCCPYLFNINVNKLNYTNLSLDFDRNNEKLSNILMKSIIVHENNSCMFCESICSNLKKQKLIERGLGDILIFELINKCNSYNNELIKCSGFVNIFLKIYINTIMKFVPAFSMEEIQGIKRYDIENLFEQTISTIEELANDNNYHIQEINFESKEELDKNFYISNDIILRLINIYKCNLECFYISSKHDRNRYLFNEKFKLRQTLNVDCDTNLPQELIDSIYSKKEKIIEYFMNKNPEYFIPSDEFIDEQNKMIGCLTAGMRNDMFVTFIIDENMNADIFVGKFLVLLDNIIHQNNIFEKIKSLGLDIDLSNTNIDVINQYLNEKYNAFKIESLQIIETEFIEFYEINCKLLQDKQYLSQINKYKYVSKLLLNILLKSSLCNNEMKDLIKNIF